MQSARILLALAVPTSIAIAVAACGNDSSTTNAPAASASATTSATASGTTSPQAQPRKLIEGKLIPTSPGNLLLDPGFGQLQSQEASYGSFIGQYQDTGEQFVAPAFIDSRSPAGFSGNVANLLSAMATDTKSRPISLLSSFIGGTGPFHAELWVAKTNVAGAPAPFSPSDKTISITVATDFGDLHLPANTHVYTLVPADAPVTAGNGRAWWHYALDITDPLPNGAFLMIQTTTKGGAFLLAAPAVTSVSLEKELATQSLVRVTPRDATEDELRAIRAYKSQKLSYRAPHAEKIRGE